VEVGGASFYRKREFAYGRRAGHVVVAIEYLDNRIGWKKSAD
jgi:hypothetical protein